MADYKKMYHILFNAITDSIMQLEESDYDAARDTLVKAQQTTEDAYILGQDE